MMQDIVKES